MKWQSFQSHLQTSNNELYHTKQFADVTLVSDDMVKFPAHKTILAASSKVFKSLLSMATSDQQQYPFLYLKDINHKDLEDVLQYIYLGRAKVSLNRTKYIENIMKDLGIPENCVDSFGESQVKEIKPEEENLVDKLDFLLFETENEIQQDSFNSSDRIKGNTMEKTWNVKGTTDEAYDKDHDDSFNSKDGKEGNEKTWDVKEETDEAYYEDCDDQDAYQEDNNDLEVVDSYQEDCNGDNIPEAGDLYQVDENSKTVPVNGNVDKEGIGAEKPLEKTKKKRKISNQYRKKEEEPTECEMCLAKFTTKRSYQRHYKVIHELKMQECDECGKQFKAWGKIDKHKQSVHQKIKYSCSQCEYKAASVAQIRKHTKKVHWFHCENCKVSYDNKSEFQNHIQTEHIAKYC